MKIKVPHFRDDVPLFILFRAMGYISDKEIISLIFGKKLDPEYYELLKPSIIDSENIQTREEALHYIKSHLTIKTSNVEDVLLRDILPHLGDNIKCKMLFLGYMAKCLLDCILNKRTLSDRDHYANKRVELPGTLLSQVFRRLYNKMLKDLKGSIYKEISTNCELNVIKLIKSSTIEI